MEREQDASSGRGRAGAVDHWRRAVRDLPNRLVLPARGGEYVHHGAVHRTDRLGILLALAARRHRTSPSVVYHALVLGLLAAQSGAP